MLKVENWFTVYRLQFTVRSLIHNFGYRRKYSRSEIKINFDLFCISLAYS